MATDTASSGSPGSTGPIGALRNRLEGPNTIGNTRGFWVGFVVVVAGLAAYPYAPDAVTGAFVGVGTFSSFLCYTFLALSLAIVWGYGGILSFGQSVFYGVAGYAFMVVALNLNSTFGVTVGVLTGIVGGAVLSAVLGYFIFYGGVRDVYATIITLVSTLVLQTFMQQTAGDEWTVGAVALGGFNGINLSLPFRLGVEGAAIGFDPLANPAGFFHLVLGLLVVTYLGLRVLVNSDYGRVMVAVREDEDRTRMFGYKTERVKLVVFTVGGALAGLGGVLFNVQRAFIDPNVFSLTVASLPVIWVGLGGRKTLLGPIVATVALQYLSNTMGDQWADVIKGLLLVGFILVLPGGVVPQLRDGVLWVQRRLLGTEPARTPGEEPAPTPGDGGDPDAEVSDS